MEGVHIGCSWDREKDKDIEEGEDCHEQIGRGLRVQNGVWKWQGVQLG